MDRSSLLLPWSKVQISSIHWILFYIKLYRLLVTSRVIGEIDFSFYMGLYVSTNTYILLSWHLSFFHFSISVILFLFHLWEISLTFYKEMLLLRWLFETISSTIYLRLQNVCLQSEGKWPNITHIPREIAIPSAHKLSC